MKKDNKNKKTNNNVKKIIKKIKKNKILILLILVCIANVIMLGFFIHDNRRINKLINEEEKYELKNKKLSEENSELLKRLEKQNKKVEIGKEGMATKIPIITFHRTVDSESKKKYFADSEWVNDLSVTESELKYLYDNGWKTIDLDEFYCWYNKDCEFPIKTFAITIDDGDSEAYYNILPILEKYNFDATLFSIGVAIPDKTEPLNEPKRQKLGYDVIKELRDKKSLLQVESHSYDLHHLEGKKEAVLTKSYKELQEDFKNNEKFEFKYIAYPYGVYNKKMLQATANSNIKMAFKFKKGTYATRLDNKYEIARIKVNSYMNLEDFKKIFDYAK